MFKSINSILNKKVMIKNNTFSRLAQATAGLGLVAALGVIAAPAQAAVLNGTLATSDGTTDFYQLFIDPLNPAGQAPPPTFSVVFSPVVQGGLTVVNAATGQFDPFFSTPPLQLVSTAPPESGRAANFTFTGGSNAGFSYTLDNPISFSLNGVVKTISSGSTFTGLVNGTSVELSLASGTAVNSTVLIPGDGTYTFNNPQREITGLAFTFNDTPATGGGSWSGNVDLRSQESVPEPSALLGLLAVSGLAFGLKGKKA